MALKKTKFNDAVQRIIDIQIKLAAAKGEPWAIKEYKISSNDIDKTRLQTAIDLAKKASKKLTYVKKFDKIAQDLLGSVAFASTEHLCVVFQCDEATLDLWKEANHSFDSAITLGLLEGGVKARELITKHATSPSSTVNNNLLLLLLNNVYNIKEDNSLKLDANIKETIIVNDREDL